MFARGLTSQTAPWLGIYLSLSSIFSFPKSETKPPALPQRLSGLDPEALARLHDEFYPEVFRYARYRLDDEPAAEDVAAEVFLRLLQALQKQDYTIENLHAWLIRTTANLVNDYYRAHYRRPLVELDETTAAPGLSPEGLAEHTWQIRQIRAAMQQLTLEQQHVLALRFADERPLEETARLMGKSVSAIKTLQFRALVSLRRVLGTPE